MFAELKRIAEAVERIADVMEELKDEQKKIVGVSQAATERGEQMTQMLMGQFASVLGLNKNNSEEVMTKK